MLRQLLQCVADDGTCLTRDLARRLGVHETLVAQMMGDLVRQGYLRPLTETCGAGKCGGPAPACDGCALHSLCAAGRAPLWALTAKGQRLLARRA